MSEISEIREKTKEEMIKKWNDVTLYPETNLNQGNFVTRYIPMSYFSKNDYSIAYSISAIEYHIRMLNDIKNYIVDVQKQRKPIGIEEKYAVQRLENAITLLENHRAELLFVNIQLEIKKLKDARIKKDLERLDWSITGLYRTGFEKNGYVRPYLTRGEE